MTKLLSILTALALTFVGAVFLSPPVAAEGDVCQVTFTVTGTDGAPIAGAAVSVWNDDEVRKAITDADGRAQLEAVSVGEWTASAAAEKWTAEEKDVDLGETAERTISFTLAPGTPFSGRVVDATGAPVKSAYVEAIAGGTFEGYSEVKSRGPYARLHSTEDGGFRVGGIPVGAVTTLVVSAEGFRETRFAVRAQGDSVRPSPVVIVLDRGGTVSGRVLSADDHPVPGAVVFLVPADNRQLIRTPRTSIWKSDGKSVAARIVRADAEGRFAVSGLAFGESLVGLSEAAGHARSLPSAPVTPVDATPAVELDLRLRVATTIAVRLSSEGGKPVTSAVVRATAELDGDFESKTPDGNGAFVLTGMAEGEVEITIDADGFQPQTVRANATAKKVAEVAVTLDAGATLVGVARDEAGKPLAGVDVYLTLEKTAPNGGWSSASAGRATTDAEGRFLIAGLERLPHKLNAAIREVYALEDEITVEVPNTALELVLRKMGTLRARFVPPEGGAPVPGRAMVWRFDLDTGSGFGRGRGLDGDVLTLGDGCGKRERLRVTFDGFVPFEREVQVAWGEDVDLGDVMLDPGAPCRGVVVDGDGKPVSGALVAWTDESEAVTALDGSFALAHLPSGDAEVTVKANGFLPLKTKVTTGAEAALTKLTLFRGGVIAGRLLDESGEPRSDHWMQFRRPPTEADGPKGEFLGQIGTDDDGTFEIRVPAGTCRVLFIDGETIHVLATVTVVEGKHEKRELTLKLE